jgi:hypothetical protein
MSRFKKSLKPGIDQLERREVLSSGGPSDQAQYMLELINEARTNPAAAAERVTADPSPDIVMTMNHYGESLSLAASQVSSAQAKQPLAWNDKLADAATMQSQYQADSGQQTHDGPNGMNLDQRLAAKGYSTNAGSTENAYAYARSVDRAMQAFLIDWGVSDRGHRRNIQQTDVNSDKAYNEVGIGIVSTTNKNLGPLVITQNFARSSTNPAPKLLGVVYNDNDRNSFYTPGEGVNQVQIRAQNLETGEVASTNNWDSGGYQLELKPGRYRVSARRGVKSLGVQDVTVGNENVKVDFVADPDSALTVVEETPVATPETPTVPKERQAVFSASRSMTSALASSTKFESSSIRNWSSWKPRN